jgi:Mg2+ and Co2+ transporter CorA
VACEDRTSALEREVAAQITGMRHELGEIRALLTALLESDGDTSELIGRLLRATTERLQALEESFEHSSELRARTEHAG